VSSNSGQVDAYERRKNPHHINADNRRDHFGSSPCQGPLLYRRDEPFSTGGTNEGASESFASYSLCSRVSCPPGEEFKVYSRCIVIIVPFGGIASLHLFRPTRYLFCHEEVTHGDASIEVAKVLGLSGFTHFVEFDRQFSVSLRFFQRISHNSPTTFVGIVLRAKPFPNGQRWPQQISSLPRDGFTSGFSTRVPANIAAIGRARQHPGIGRPSLKRSRETVIE
jgi:hypothetical protein